MSRTALVFYGGWDGHDPEGVGRMTAEMLEKNGYEVRLENGMDSLADRDYLKSLSLIVPCWTMGEIDNALVKNISEAVINGTGLAGCHGGMCDAFRNDTDWQFITGGQWVAHPGGEVNYTVNICKEANPITDGINDFSLCSEQYYLHIDPAVKVLATTHLPVANGPHCANGDVEMPVVWTKFWGLGRVFYNSIGHNAGVFENCSEAKLLMERGLLWAGDGKAYAGMNGLTADKYIED